MPAYRGKRSLPSCLSGGDLDGDDYNLILNVSYICHTFDLNVDEFGQRTLHPPTIRRPGPCESVPNKKNATPPVSPNP